MLEYNTVDKSGDKITIIVFVLLEVEGKRKLLAGGRYFISQWLLCFINFNIFHFFPIFRLSMIFLNFSDTGIVFSGKFCIDVFLGIFLTKFEAGTAKYQNLSANIFLISKKYIVTWNYAQKFPIPFGGLKIFLKPYFWVTNIWKIFSANLGGVGWTFLLTWRGITQLLHREFCAHIYEQKNES